MPDLDASTVFKQFMGAFRFGRGLLGRSSNVFISLVALAGAAIWRLHSETFIAGIFGAVFLGFFIWYFRVERFAHKHPLESLLEGGEYTAHHRMILASKGQPLIQIDPQESEVGIVKGSDSEPKDNG
jgi:hypothetical protein